MGFPESAHIPVYLTSLVGRAQELSEVAGALHAHRLVSLVGAGGSGKSRLAAAVATELRNCYGRDIAWVDLAPLSEPGRVASHVAAGLGLREQAGRALPDSLVEGIGRRDVLLVLDNCEHLVAPCGSLVDMLLRGCPALRVLVTSRQALAVEGEKAWQVPPLALPMPGDPRAAATGAVQLFVQRARDVLPGFALTDANVDAVVRICRRLDGLPLAIELAAARVKLLPPDQLASRLDGIFNLLISPSRVTLPRHRTLRALIDWSYDLLSAEERVLFERLAVFAGGFTLDAAESVVGDEALPSGDVLDLLAGLLDKSLVSMTEWHGEARYTLLETVRQYAQQRLVQSSARNGAEAVGRLHRTHAAHYAALAERAVVELHREAQLEWLARLDAEHDNLSAALAWSVSAGDPELALRLCAGLRDYWRIRGHLSEGRRWMEEALRLPGACGALRARALVGIAVLARMQGDYASCQEWLTESERLARDAVDRAALAETLTQLGISLRDRQQFDTARERLDEAISVWRELTDARGLTLALGARSSIALAQGDLAVARALRLEAMEVARQAADRDGEARAWIGMGEVARLQGDLDEARAYNERSLELFQQLCDAWQAASAHHNLGWIAVESGRLHDAYYAFSESIATFRTAGNPFGLTLCLFGLARTLQACGASEAAAIALATAAREAARVGLRPAAPADIVACDRTHEVVEGTLDEAALTRAKSDAASLGLLERIEWAREKLQAALPPPARPTTRAGRNARVAKDSARARARTVDADSAEPALRVRALGPLQVFLAGRPLEGEAFASGKPRELLLFLLCHPEGCTREQVGLAFWPESTGAQVKNSFHVTLFRLRKALQHPDWITVAGDRYRLDPALRVEFDAARFEVEIRAALERGGDGAESGRRLAAALDLYGGDFLENEIVGDWHLETRGRLRRYYLEGLRVYGTLLMAEERFAEAAVTFRSLLAGDPIHEEACRQLMICHGRIGERTQAIRLYESFRALLRDELGTAPERTTTALYERLQGAVPL